MRKHRTWVRLNVEGKRFWGDIFPDSVIPVQSVATRQAKFEGIKDAESAFIVNWKALTPKEQQAILEKLTEQTGATKDTILKDILKVGLPIRRRHTIGCGTSRMELYS